MFNCKPRIYCRAKGDFDIVNHNLRFLVETAWVGGNTRFPKMLPEFDSKCVVSSPLCS